ncbi:MAG: hypothetical protein ACRDN0_19490, partial [Trebonia sp.]
AAVGTAAFTPVLAAARPVPGTAHAKGTAHARDKVQAKDKVHAKDVTATDPVRIVSQYGHGKYMSILTCGGVDTPPPIRLKAPGAPLTLKGTGPSAGETKALSKPKAYMKVFKCTIMLDEKVPPTPGCELAAGGPGSGGPGDSGTGAAACHRQVTLNTGFGGEAASVALHHPRK